MDLEQRTGLTSRPLEPEEARDVFEVMAAAEVVDLGMVEIEEADIIGDWGRPSFDITASTLGVFEGDRLVGYAEVTGGDRGDAAVHPAYRGRGIGTRLAHWMQETARRRGATLIGMPVPADSPSDRLLAALGYHVRWTSWVLKLPPGATIVERDLPDGYAVRAAEPSEHTAVPALVEDAFLEWSVRERQPFEGFAASVLGRPGFAPWNLRVVVDDTGTVVGVAHVVMARTDDQRQSEACIARLDIRRDLRGRGLAQALMVDAFAVARLHGALVCGLPTDSRTGALGLYEQVGMEVTSVWVNRAVTL